MSNFRRNKPRKQPRCRMCQWYRFIDGPYHKHFRALTAKDPLTHLPRTGNKVRPEAWA